MSTAHTYVTRESSPLPLKPRHLVLFSGRLVVQAQVQVEQPAPKSTGRFDFVIHAIKHAHRTGCTLNLVRATTRLRAELEAAIEESPCGREDQSIRAGLDGEAPPSTGRLGALRTLLRWLFGDKCFVQLISNTRREFDQQTIRSYSHHPIDHEADDHFRTAPTHAPSRLGAAFIETMARGETSALMLAISQMRRELHNYLPLGHAHRDVCLAFIQGLGVISVQLAELLVPLQYRLPTGPWPGGVVDRAQRAHLALTRPEFRRLCDPVLDPPVPLLLRTIDVPVVLPRGMCIMIEKTPSPSLSTTLNVSEVPTVTSSSRQKRDRSPSKSGSRFFSHTCSPNPQSDFPNCL